MEGAADLFVEESVLGELFDRVVGADGDLAHVAGALVLVEHREEELFVLGGTGINDAVVLKLKTNALDLSPVVDPGEGVVDMPVGILWAAKDFAVGEVFAAGAVDPDGLFLVHIDAEIGAIVTIASGCFEMHLVLGLQEIAHQLLAFVDIFPRGNGIRQMQQPCFEHKFLILCQAHFRILRRGECWVERAAPAEIAVSSSLEEGIHPRTIGNTVHRDLLRIYTRERFGIRIRPEPDAHIDGLGEIHFDGVEKLELLLGAMLKEDVGEGAVPHRPEGVPAGFEDCFKGRFDHGQCDWISADCDEITFFDLRRVFYNHISKFIEALIAHQGLLSGNY